jgi:FkbM family methyltransferase
MTMTGLMKSALKMALGKRLLGVINKTRGDLTDRCGHRSYSQEGEDRVLSSLLFKLHGGMHVKTGFYVDVGAHHPYRFSNTCLFYRQGWRGINIDAMPGSMLAFAKQRPRDINLESGVGRKAETLKFFVFNEPALNTFDESLARARCNDVWRIEAIVDVPVLPLAEILNKHVPEGQRIDFFSVDVEGFDLEVLQSNDWQKYRPRVVLVETFGLSLADLASDPLTEFLHSLRYIEYSKSVNTTFFVDEVIIQQASEQLPASPRVNSDD